MSIDATRPDALTNSSTDPAENESATGRPASPPEMRRALAWIAAIASFLLFWNLHRGPVADWDEAWHGKIALDMVQSGQWLTYDFDGQIESGAMKPPLCFWAMGASFKLLGPTPLGVRVFAAACFLALVLIVADFGLRHFHAPAAVMATLLLAADPVLLFKHCARSGEMDAPLMLFLTLTVLAVWRLRRGGSAWWVGLAYAGAFLVKGVAALQLVPVVALWLALTRQWRALARCVPAMILAAVPYAVFITVREARQPGVIRLLFDQEFMGRVSGGFAGHCTDPFSYVWSLLRSAHPVLAALLVLAALAGSRPRLSAQAADPSETGPLLSLLLVWWLVPFLLFSAAGTHHDNYVYPTYVPAYLLAGWCIAAFSRQLEAIGRGRLARAIVILMFAVFAAPSVWKTIHWGSANRERVAEFDLLVATIRRETGGTDILLYKGWPSVRFALTTAGVQYRAIDAEEVTAIPLRAGQYVVYRSAEPARPVEPSDVSMQPIVTLPRTGYVLAVASPSPPASEQATGDAQ